MKTETIYILFARRPEPGTVKTRLAESIGPAAAARIYRATLTDSIRNLKTLGFPFAVAYTPSDAGAYFKKQAPDGHNFPQNGDDLGERMARAFQNCFRDGFSRVIGIGSDIPGLSPEILLSAENTLKMRRAVIGPCSDGGYYLIGLNEFLPELFSGIEWGSDTVLETTLEKLNRRELGFRLLPELIDLDRVEDLQLIVKQLSSMKDTEFARVIRGLSAARQPVAS